MHFILYLVLAAVLCRVHKIIHEFYHIVNGLGLRYERNDADAEGDQSPVSLHGGRKLRMKFVDHEPR
jgi:hypothetical protein